MKAMTKLSIFAALAFLPACMGSEPAPSSLQSDRMATSGRSAPTVVAAATPGTATVQWFDSDVFDTNMSQSLGRNISTVKVETGPMGSTAVPARLNSWLVEVQDRGGQVSVQTRRNFEGESDGIRTRSIIAMLLPFAFDYLKQKVSHEITYRAARNYDAVVVTSEDRNRIEYLVFLHKNAAQ